MSFPRLGYKNGGGTPSLDFSLAYSDESRCQIRVILWRGPNNKELRGPSSPQSVCHPVGNWVLPTTGCVWAWEQILSQLNLEMTATLDNIMAAACQRTKLSCTRSLTQRNCEPVNVSYFKLLHFTVIYYTARDDQFKFLFPRVESKDFSCEIRWWREMEKTKTLRMAESKEHRLDSWP